jgi:hypothetical protein
MEKFDKFVVMKYCCFRSYESINEDDYVGEPEF